MISEGGILLRVKDLEQRRRRVATKVRTELVDLVEDEDRVLRFRPTQPLDDLPGAARLCVGDDPGSRFIAHAAERYADELARQRLRDGACR